MLKRTQYEGRESMHGIFFTLYFFCPDSLALQDLVIAILKTKIQKIYTKKNIQLFS